MLRRRGTARCRNSEYELEVRICAVGHVFRGGLGVVHLGSGARLEPSVAYSCAPAGMAVELWLTVAVDGGKRKTISGRSDPGGNGRD
jgi:hypothetical protein